MAKLGGWMAFMTGVRGGGGRHSNGKAWRVNGLYDSKCQGDTPMARLGGWMAFMTGVGGGGGGGGGGETLQWQGLEGGWLV